MAITATLSVSLSEPGLAGGAIAITSNDKSAMSYTWGSAPTNELHNFYIATGSGHLKGLWIQSTVAATLYTNDVSSGSPTNTIALTANTPVIWVPGSGTQPLSSSVDVTKIYLTSVPAAGHLDVVAYYS